MRPVWKGHISFGLVNIPVVLYPAENRSELHFNLMDRRNMGHVRYERVNEVTGETVPWDEIVKAYEHSEGNFVVVEEDDFKRAAVEATQTVAIEDFVDETAVDFTYFDKPYYLVPGKKGEKGYVLLREVLKRARKVGIAKVVIHTRQYLAALIAQGNALVLNLLRFQDELRPASEFEFPGANLKEWKISDKELAMAEKLVESMSGKWEPKKYRDEYRDALMKWIEKKAKHGELAVPPEAEEEAVAEGAEIVDMMDLLQKSIRGKGREAAEAAEGRRGSAAVGMKTAKRKKAA